MAYADRERALDEDDQDPWAIEGPTHTVYTKFVLQVEDPDLARRVVAQWVAGMPRLEHFEFIPPPEDQMTRPIKQDEIGGS